MIRTALILVTAGTLGACAANQPYEMSEKDAAELKEALADRVAGEPESCLSLQTTRNSQIVDGQHILFKQGRTTWLNQPQMQCPLLGRVGYAMVLEPTVGTHVCRGDVIKVMDTSTRSIIAACSFGEFVPYRLAERE